MAELYIGPPTVCTPEHAQGVAGHLDPADQAGILEAARKLGHAMTEIVHEGRASNVDVHRLARSSIYETEGWHVWFLFPPWSLYQLY